MKQQLGAGPELLLWAHPLGGAAGPSHCPSIHGITQLEELLVYLWLGGTDILHRVSDVAESLISHGSFMCIYEMILMHNAMHIKV